MDSQLSSNTENTLVGQTIDHGRYELLRVIGEGGMGRVYEARQKRVERLVAVKVLHSHWVKDPKLVERFKREALTASQFRHPNTVMVYDYGETDTGELYIIMELLKGQSLLSLLDKEGPLTLDRSLKIIDQICGAVSEVHRCGVIHRDLKPENIQIDPRDGHPDFVKLLDFSIAKLVNDNAISSVNANQNLTLQGAVFGTPQYMSPEQVRGRSLDQRTDIYALGVIFYQMLTGFVPFSEPTPQGTMMAHLTEPVPRFEVRVPHLDIHPSVAQIIYDCLEKAPDDRIKSSDELISRIVDLKITLQREAELQNSGDTDSGIPSVTSRLTSPEPSDTLENQSEIRSDQLEAIQAEKQGEGAEKQGEGAGDQDRASSALNEKAPLASQSSLSSQLRVSKLKPSALSSRVPTSKLASASPQASATSQENDQSEDPDHIVTIAADSTELLSSDHQEVETEQAKETADTPKGDHSARSDLNEDDKSTENHVEEDELETGDFTSKETQEYRPDIHGSLTDDAIDVHETAERSINQPSTPPALVEIQSVETSFASPEVELSEDQKITSELKNHIEPFSELLTPQLVPPEALPHTDSELHVSTGVFQAPPAKRHISLSVALVGAIAFVVFVTLNPDILARLFTLQPQITTGPSIQLGSNLNKIRYRLESSPTNAVIKCNGEYVGRTTFEWTHEEQPKLAQANCQVSAPGFQPQWISLSSLNLNENDPTLKSQHINLKTLSTETLIEGSSSDQPHGVATPSTKSSPQSQKETIEGGHKARSKRSQGSPLQQRQSTKGRKKRERKLKTRGRKTIPSKPTKTSDQNQDQAPGESQHETSAPSTPTTTPISTPTPKPESVAPAPKETGVPELSPIPEDQPLDEAKFPIPQQL